LQAKSIDTALFAVRLLSHEEEEKDEEGKKIMIVSRKQGELIKRHDSEKKTSKSIFQRTDYIRRHEADASTSPQAYVKTHQGEKQGNSLHVC